MKKILVLAGLFFCAGLSLAETYTISGEIVTCTSRNDTRCMTYEQKQAYAAELDAISNAYAEDNAAFRAYLEEQEKKEKEEKKLINKIKKGGNDILNVILYPFKLVIRLFK